jgi:hypothetical protein
VGSSEALALRIDVEETVMIVCHRQVIRKKQSKGLAFGEGRERG